MTDPVRFQLRRTRGWRIPEGGVSVARPGRWGNPFRVDSGLDSAGAVEMFRRDLAAGSLDITVEDVRRDLAGHHLGCWCRVGQPCHGDVLLVVAAGADPASVEVLGLA